MMEEAPFLVLSMPSPPILVFLTTIASQPALRQRQEYLLRILQVKQIPFTSYDLASDEDAKRLWKRKAPLDKQQLPGILVGGRFPGTFSDFEEAVEYDELDTFLRLKDPWDPQVDEDRPAPVAKPIGVPGAAMPLQMTPEHLRSKILAPTASPLRGKGKGADLPVNKRQNEVDLGDELAGYGLQGVKVTDDELRNLVAELGLDGDDAADLVGGLSGNAGAEKTIILEKDDKEGGASGSPDKPTAPGTVSENDGKQTGKEDKEEEANLKDRLQKGAVEAAEA